MAIETVRVEELKVPQSDKAKIQEQIEVEKLKKELEVQRLGFKDIAEFSEAKKRVDLKEVDLMKREDTISTREEICVKRENEVVRAAEINEAVKTNLQTHVIEDFKKAKAVREFAFLNYFNSFEILCQKLYNGKAGKSCMGLVKRQFNVRGRSVDKLVDVSVVIDADFLEELKPIIISIQTALKVSPKFSTEGEFLTSDESLLEENMEGETEEAEV